MHDEVLYPTKITIGEATANHGDKQLLQVFVVFEYCGIVLITIVFILFHLRVVYPFLKPYQRIDIANFGSILFYIFRIYDTITDILICICFAILNQDLYLNLSTIFLYLPLTLSIIFVLYHTQNKWHIDKLYKNVHKSSTNGSKNDKEVQIEVQSVNTRNPKYLSAHRLIKFIENYRIVIIVLTLLSFDFHGTILLFESKLFCWNIFNLQLKQSEKESLIIYKWINVIFAQNIPQAMIQIIFLQNQSMMLNSEDRRIIVILVAFSLFFNFLNVIPILLSILMKLKYVWIICVSKRIKDSRYVTICDARMIVRSDNFILRKYAIIHNKVKKSLNIALKKEKIANLWESDSDIKINFIVDVYFIDDSRLKELKQVTVYFSIKFICDNDSDSKMQSIIYSTINNLDGKSSSMQQDFTKSMQILLKCDNIEVVEGSLQLFGYDTISMSSNHGQAPSGQGVHADRVGSLSPNFGGIASRSMSEVENEGGLSQPI